MGSEDCWSQKTSRMNWKIHGKGGKIGIYHKNNEYCMDMA